MANKMPPEILAHFKSKNPDSKKESDKESDKDKRKAALEKARKYQENKRKK